jgi:putative hydrolase of the HAD superfamily
MPSAESLDAVTVDAFRTLVELADPVPALEEALARRGHVRDDAQVRVAFAAEVAYYVPRAHTGADPESLLTLRTECARVFLEAAEAPVDPSEFAGDFVGALRFTTIPGVEAALGGLRAAGLALACVANWDVSLEGFLEGAGVSRYFDAIVSAAEAGAQKPEPRIFELALERLGVERGRTLHIGDDDADRTGAAVAGLAFEPVPLSTLPARLGISAP